MPKIFLAYSRRHRPSVERLVESLERISPTIDIWYGDRNIQPGADVTQSINDAIQQADIFVFCTSAAPSFTREGIVLAQEKQKALERFESDRNFRVINVVFGQIEHMPSSFRNFPISALSHP